MCVYYMPMYNCNKNKSVLSFLSMSIKIVCFYNFVILFLPLKLTGDIV